MTIHLQVVTSPWVRPTFRPGQVWQYDWNAFQVKSKRRSDELTCPRRKRTTLHVKNATNFMFHANFTQHWRLTMKPYVQKKLSSGDKTRSYDRKTRKQTGPHTRGLPTEQHGGRPTQTENHEIIARRSPSGQQIPVGSTSDVDWYQTVVSESCIGVTKSVMTNYNLENMVRKLNGTSINNITRRRRTQYRRRRGGRSQSIAGSHCRTAMQ